MAGISIKEPAFPEFFIENQFLKSPNFVGNSGIFGNGQTSWTQATTM